MSGLTCNLLYFYVI